MIKKYNQKIKSRFSNLFGEKIQINNFEIYKNVDYWQKINVKDNIRRS